MYVKVKNEYKLPLIEDQIPLHFYGQNNVNSDHAEFIKVRKHFKTGIPILIRNRYAALNNSNKLSFTKLSFP